MSNSQYRNEYIENTIGVIWQGLSDDNTGYKWEFDQFNYNNLEISINTLKRLSLFYRNNTVLISRQISYSIGNDICYGKWGSGSYTSGRPSGGYYCSKTKENCKDPSSWTGTTGLFETYLSVNKKPVQYCQCFVYAGVFTTVGRSLGIPTRPVTTFQSAHDTNFNRAIEKYYILEEDSGVYDPTSDGIDNSDSIWSFHVWNEMYFDRNDIDRNSYSSSVNINANGWQAVDATPQEYSIGGNPGIINGATSKVYQMGPASINFVKNNLNPNCINNSYTYAIGKRYGCYDNEFVISEVNANYNFWYKKGKNSEKWILYDSYNTDPWGDDYGTIGLQISTKKPKSSISDNCLSQTVSDCSADLLEITNNYKKSEPSSPGIPTNSTYYYTKGATVDVTTRRRRRLGNKRSRRLLSKSNGVGIRGMGVNEERLRIDHDYDYDYDGRRRSLLWEEVIWETNETMEKNDTDVFDNEGITYDVISFPPEWYYSPMIVADRETEYLYGDDYSMSYFGIGVNSFSNRNLSCYCSITITALDYSGRVLYLNNNTNDTIVKYDKKSFVLKPGEYGECIFNLNYNEYSDWIIDDLDISSKVYSFEFDFSMTFYVNNGNNSGLDYNISDIYDAIIERRQISVCTPLYRLRDRVICENGLRWFKPDYNLTYECDNIENINIDNKSLGDGFCDDSNNIESCYDYGDCCQSSCIPSNEYNCEYFNCIDTRTSEFSYYYCNDITGFINYMNNNISNNNSCNNGLTSDDFNCSSNVWNANTDNICVNDVMKADGIFGEFETCVNNTWNSLETNAQQVISVILQCLEYLDENDANYNPSNDSYSANITSMWTTQQSSNNGGSGRSSSDNDSWIDSNWWVILVICIVVIACVIIAGVVYMRNKKKQSYATDSSYVQM